ncbi:uncharacterized protein [Dysidea avara]|uniref:uncharacterized protein n=1 Tax=Dysidea avara TaxID=196820 RepID=UPI00331EE1C3
MQGARGNHDGSYSIIHNTISQGNIGFIDQHGLSLDHSLYEVGRNDNEPADASSPIKPGGFLTVFFKDRKLLSPIVQLPAVCSKVSPSKIPAFDKSVSCEASQGKDHVALILDLPTGISKCKRKLQFSDDDNVARQQNPRKRKCKLLKTDNVETDVQEKSKCDAYGHVTTGILINSTTTAVPINSTTSTAKTTTIPVNSTSTAMPTTTAVPDKSTTTAISTSSKISIGVTSSTTTKKNNWKAF